MHGLSLLALGFSMLIIQAALATLIPLHGFAPNLLLPIAIYLGISGDVSMVRGATICFVLGYILDAFCGNPMGLQTFTLVASFMIARGAGVRLFPKGLGFQLLLTFIMGIISGGTILALRAIFEPPSPFPTDDASYHVRTLFQYSFATAIVALGIFPMIAKLDDWFLQRVSDRKPVGA